MVTITDLAAKKGMEVLDAEGKAGWGFRIFLAGGGCCPSYGIDIDERAKEGDHIMEKDGLKVFIDEATYGRLRGMDIDYISGPDGEGFVLKGGVPSSGCSCS